MSYYQVETPLTLHSDPVSPMHPVTKQYVDGKATNVAASRFLSGVIPVEKLPALVGDVSTLAGSNAVTLTGTGVAAGVYNTYTVDGKGRVTAAAFVNQTTQNLSWTLVKNTPTTLSGYGINDVLSTITGDTVRSISVTGTPAGTSAEIPKKSEVDLTFTDVTFSGHVATGEVVRSPSPTPALGFLRPNGGVVSKVSYPELYAVLGDDFNNYDKVSNTWQTMGRPWKNQTGFNTSVNPASLVMSAGTDLPAAMTLCGSIITKNRAYLVGGYDGTSYLSRVYTAPIDAAGVIGTWSTATPLPAAMANIELTLIKDRVYIFGGSRNNASLATVYYAVVNEDGTLGNWVADKNLPGVIAECRSLVTKNRVYLIGGSTVPNATYVGTVYTALINDDGSLGGWATSSNLPAAVAHAGIVSIRNRVYLFGGFNGTSYLSSVYTAPINDDGTLGTWVATTSLPITFTHVQAFATNGRIYLQGVRGANSSSWVKTGLTCTLTESGGLNNDWVDATTSGEVQAAASVLITSSRVYVLGGQGGINLTKVYYAPFSGGLNDYMGLQKSIAASYYPPAGYMGQPWRNQATFNNTDPGALTWTTAVSTPAGFSYSGVLVTKNRIHLLGGGTTTTQLASTYSALINEDGSLGSWVRGADLPVAMLYVFPIVTKNRVYLIGGWSASDTKPIDLIYTAPINEDGTLGTWVSEPNIPGQVSARRCFVTKNRVYALGGAVSGGTSYLSTAYTAPINPDGTLGMWSVAPTPPVSSLYAESLVTKTRVYLIGGWQNNNYVNTTCSAPINADGTLGAWEAGPNFPIVVCHSQVFSTKTRAYLVGGVNTAFLNSVYTAPINADGTLGTWTASNPLPGINGRNSIAITKSTAYLMCGTESHGSFTNKVYSAPFTGGLNDYYTLINTNVINLTNDFRLPDYTSQQTDGLYYYIKS